MSCAGQRAALASDAARNADRTGTKYVWTNSRCLEEPGSILEFNWMDTKQARLEDCSVCAQSFDHFKGESFGRLYCIVYYSLLGPETINPLGGPVDHS